MLRHIAPLAVFAQITALASGLFAAELTPQETQFFEKKIRPVLVSECYSCHSKDAQKVKGGLLLDTREGIRQGGDTGPAVVPGSVADSLIIEAMRHESLEMPPEKMLPETVIADFVKWIEDGAADPREGVALVRRKIDIEQGKEFWSFQAPRDVPPPKLNDDAWASDPIDRYLLASREAQGLSTAADAVPEVLLRRLYFDLIGLPPTPEQIAEFVADPSPKHYSQIVDQLLDSPQYGERWGRHWLDVARFAESNGRERNVLYPHAWRYSRYVIDAFNNDKPYDQFLREQVAGDLLPAETPAQRDEQRIATGLLAIGPKLLNERDVLAFNMDMIDEQIDIVSRSIMAISVSCARCHDHKFDPIPTDDYYALAGIFRSSQTLYGTTGANGNRQPSKLISVGFENKGEAAEFVAHEKEMKECQQKVAAIPKQILKIEQNQKKNADNPKLAERMAELNGELTAARKRLNELKKLAPAQPQYAMGLDEGKPGDCRICIRGETDSLGEEVPRGLVRVISVGREIEIPADASGRLQVAEWLTDANNPLTARVMANRIWQHLFGRGIVATPDNFGVNGDAPSHPELLDHLALRFVSEGWSMKQMVRTLVHTRSYRLSSEFNQQNYGIDPDNVTLWRMAPRRLDAEAIRDSMLAVSGQLDLEPPASSPIAGTDGQVGRGIDVDDISRESRNRSVYLPIIRNAVPEALQVFDFAEPSLIVGARQQTTVPAQALFIMNSPFVLQQSGHFAEKLLAKEASEAERVARAYALTVGRSPSEQEQERAAAFLAQARTLVEGDKQEAMAWTGLCQALFASAEFRYVR